MTGIAAGLTGFGVLLGLMAIRMPIAMAMLATGVAGYGPVNGWMPLLAYLKTNTCHQFSTCSLSVNPLFVLMGEFAIRAGMSRELYRAAAAFLGHILGGLAHGLDRGLRGLRDDLRLVAGHRRRHGAGRPARDAALQLFGGRLPQARWPPGGRRAS